jgi:hypothetical protein
VLVLTGPPQVRTVRPRVGAAVGGHHRSVQIQMSVTGGFGCGHSLGHLRRAGGQHVDALMDVAIRGRAADAVVDRELARCGDPDLLSESDLRQSELWLPPSVSADAA